MLPQTPMWSEDPQKAAMLEGPEKSVLIDPEEIARGMLELCENPEYGNGTILEVNKNHQRVVPMFNADPPSGEGSVVPGFFKAEEDIVNRIREGGIST